MDRANGTFGRSESMPLLGQNSHSQNEWEDALHDIQNSPEYQRLIADAVHAPPPRFGLLQGTHAVSTSRDEEMCSNSGANADSPESDTTVRPSPLQKDRERGSSVAVPPIGIQRTLPGLRSTAGKRDGQHDAPSSTRPASQAAVRPPGSTLPPFSFEPATAAHPTSPNSLTHARNPPVLLGTRSFPSHGHSLNSSSESFHSYATNTPQSERNQPKQGTGHMSPGEAFNSQPNRIIHRRQMNRMNSMPSIPSPLGPRHYTDDLGADSSGLVPSPSPVTPSRSQRFSLPSPAVRQMSASGLVPSPSPSTSSCGQRFSFPSPALRQTAYPPTTTPSHTPQATDPFVGAGPSKSPNTPNHRRSSAQTSFPITPSRPHGTLQAGYHHQGSPQARPHITPSPSPSPVRGLAQLGPHLRNATNRPDRPIPPPTLSSVHGRFQLSPSARDRFDAQKEVRAAWIRTEGAKIAQLARAVQNLEQQLKTNKSRVALDAYLAAKQDFANAMDLSRLHEERRNMFMPEGMRAMKTTIPGDGHAGLPMGEYGEGRLLGWKGALLERKCAVVIREGQEKAKRDAEELAAKMSEQEKKELRQECIAGIRVATERREERDGRDVMTGVEDLSSS